MAYLFQRNQNLQPYRALKEIIFIVNRLIMSIKQQSIRLKFTNQLKKYSRQSGMPSIFMSRSHFEFVILYLSRYDSLKVMTEKKELYIILNK